MSTRDASSSGAGTPDPAGHAVAATLDAGEQNCATLILNVRQAFRTLGRNEVLAVVAYDPSADLDLRAWCRMTGNHFLGRREHGRFAIYFIEKSGGA